MWWQAVTGRHAVVTLVRCGNVRSLQCTPAARITAQQLRSNKHFLKKGKRRNDILYLSGVILVVCILIEVWVTPI